jgi:hypothetical protein
MKELKIKPLEKKRIMKMLISKYFFLFFSSFEKKEKNNNATIHIIGVMIKANIFERIKNITLG